MPCASVLVQVSSRLCALELTADLTASIAKHAFVGLVDRGMCLSLVQHQTRLLLVNHAAMG